MAYRWVGLTGAASQQLARLSLLDDPGPEVESEHRSGVTLLLVELVRLGLPLADRQWLRLVPVSSHIFRSANTK